MKFLTYAKRYGKPAIRFTLCNGAMIDVAPNHVARTIEYIHGHNLDVEKIQLLIGGVAVHS